MLLWLFDLCSQASADECGSVVVWRRYHQAADPTLDPLTATGSGARHGHGGSVGGTPGRGTNDSLGGGSLALDSSLADADDTQEVIDADADADGDGDGDGDADGDGFGDGEGDLDASESKA